MTYFEQMPEQLEVAVVTPVSNRQIICRATNGRGDLSRVRDLKYRADRLQWDFHPWLG
ncbi:MAG: hypothetical protein JJ957_10750 [Pseudomonadales bacterium]|nr:hypothetical protein [Pseudomonadales bacterium]